MSLVWAPIALAVIRKGLAILGAPDDDIVQATVESAWTEVTKRVSARTERKSRSIDAVVKRQVAQFETCAVGADALAEGELSQAVECVLEHVSGLEVTYSDLERHDFDALQLASNGRAELRISIEKRRLSADAGYFAESLCVLSIRQLMAIVASTPQFSRQLSVDTYLAARDSGTRLLESLDEVFLPSVRYGSPREHAEYSARHLSGLVRQHSRVELFGLDDVPAALRRAPLDIAYVSLTAASSTVGAAGAHTKSGDFGDQHSVEEVLSHKLADAGGRGSGLRVALLGTAGSGKTTVTKWIATTVAVSTHSPDRLPSGLSSLRGKIPFLVPLRTIGAAHERLTIGDLITSSDVPASAPGGWVQAQLTDGRACLIFDGLDELPEPRKQRASEWIANICRTYRECDVVVTMRPEALDVEFITDCEFDVVTLRHMDLDQSFLVMDQWFDAQCDSVSPQLASVYRDRQISLRNRIRDDRGLQNLAESPLLTAMLCAYYASTSGDGPRDQRRLVNGVLAALLDGRERSRGLLPTELRAVHLEHKLDLLGEIARILFLEGANLLEVSPEKRGTLPMRVSVGSREVKLPKKFGGVPSSAVIDYLMRRSAIISRVGLSDAQFAHRLFLEFLAAHRFVNLGGGSDLLEAQGQPGWFAVVPNYCWIAPAYEKLRVLDALCAVENPERRWIYCLADCLSSTTSVDDETRDHIVSSLKANLPPSTEEEVSLLASLGGAALEMLARPASQPEAAAAVLTASRIRTLEALNLVEDVACGQWGVSCTELLISSWSAFDPQMYASRVLNRLDLTDVVLDIPSGAAADAVEYVSRVNSFRMLRCDGMDSLEWLRRVDKCTRLDLASATSIVDISALSSHPELRELRLANSGLVTDVDVLSELPNLRSLFIENGAELSSLAWLGGLSALRVLRLGRLRSDALKDLSGAPRGLRALEIVDSKIPEVQFLDGMPRLERLLLDSVSGSQELRLTGLEHLRRLGIVSDSNESSDLQQAAAITVLLPASGSTLRTLDIRARGQVSMRVFGLEQQTRLTEVAFSGDIWPQPPDSAERPVPWDLNFLRRSADTLRKVAITRTPRLSSLAGIQRLKGLIILDVSGTRVSTLSDYDVPSEYLVRGLTADGREETRVWRDERRLSERFSEEEMRAVRWSVADCPSLVTLTLDHCSELSDASQAASIPNLKTLNMRGSYWQSTIESLRDNLGIEVRFNFDEAVFHQETG